MSKGNYISQGWLIIVLGVVFGATLAGVQIGLSGRIADNKLADTMSQIPSLVPGAVSGEQDNHGDLIAYRAMDDKKDQVGWVVYGKGQGFADIIELLVGFDMKAEHITGLYILSQNETPGLGNRIVFPAGQEYDTVQNESLTKVNEFFQQAGPDKAFRLQFSGKPTAGQLDVVKQRAAASDNDKVDALTGATISSKSVASIVNSTVQKFKATLK
ncbi:MAG: FMN-binding protein [Spartobacteria bacterium]|nr:FMN-binding protein [Spartobacteria bacterium]